MESFKIKNFERDNPGMAFPSWEPVEPDKCASFKERIARQLGLPSTVDSLLLVRRLNEVASNSKNTGFDRSSHDLLRILQGLKIGPPLIVYINWYRFDNIDKIAFVDLCRNLEDIWYPGTDDIDIFDDTLDWVLTINHEGAIQSVTWSKANGKQ